MKKYNIIYVPIAAQDLSAAFDYILQDKPAAAQKFLQQIDARIQNLTTHPQIGIRPKDLYLKSKGYRILIVNNYLVFYIIKTKTIEIRRVLHGKRKYQFLF